jgi:hypothetical protein
MALLFFMSIRGENGVSVVTTDQNGRFISIDPRPVFNGVKIGGQSRDLDEAQENFFNDFYGKDEKEVVPEPPKNDPPATNP